MSSESLAVVIPAKNEEETIEEVIDKLFDELEEYFESVNIIVSSGSSDLTDEKARDRGAKVIKDGGTGLGEAMYRGLKKATEFDPDYILTIDSDLQFRPEEVERLLDRRDDADLVLGSRFLENGVNYNMKLSHRIGNFLLTEIVNFGSDLSLTDAQTGYRLMKTEVAEELRMMGRHTYVQETIIDAYRNGFEIKEVPISFDPRENGGSRVVSSISQYALRTLPVLIHRKGYTPYITSFTSFLLLVSSLIFILHSIIALNVFSIGFSVLMSALAVQIFYTGLRMDSDYP